MFGTTQIWVYQNPKEANADKKKYPAITYDYAQEEIAAKAGIDMSAADSNTGDLSSPPSSPASPASQTSHAFPRSR